MTRFGPKLDRKITEILATKPFTVSAEIIPPRNGADPSVVYSQIERLTQAGLDFLAVTKGAGGSLRGGSLPIAQAIKESFQVPCVAHFTCRDLLPEEVENSLVDHYFLGVRNILALRGDPPQGVSDWQPRHGSHTYAYQLIEQIRALNDGRYLERAGFAAHERQKMDFCVGAACYPDHADECERLEFFRLKVAAGAEFAISQMLFDVESYARFRDEAAGAGLNIPVLPGTRILRSQEQADRMAARFDVKLSKRLRDRLPATDREALAQPERALDAFVELTEDLRRLGAPGIHIFVLTDTDLAVSGVEHIRST
jgi:methylenetetrahydrofolate reductase (NADPH)